MKISNKQDGSFPRKSNNETVTPHQGKILTLKTIPKDRSNDD